MGSVSFLLNRFSGENFYQMLNDRVTERKLDLLCHHLGIALAAVAQWFFPFSEISKGVFKKKHTKNCIVGMIAL